MTLAVALLAAFWGVIWALALWFTPAGQFMRRQRTWLTVVIGIGADLLIAALIIPLEHWLHLVAILGLSSPAIIVLCLAGEINDHAAQLRESRRE